MSIQVSLGFSVQVLGDGSSTSVTLDLREAPLVSSNLPLQRVVDLLRNPPVGVSATGSVTGGSETVTLSLSGYSLTLTFSAAFSNFLGVSGSLLFAD
jgi:hypothetical protein